MTRKHKPRRRILAVLTAIALLSSACTLLSNTWGTASPTTAFQGVAEFTMHKSLSQGLIATWVHTCGGSYYDLSDGGTVAMRGKSNIVLADKVTHYASTHKHLTPTQRAVISNAKFSAYSNGVEPDSWVCFENIVAQLNFNDPVGIDWLADCNPGDIGVPLCGEDMMSAMVSVIFAGFGGDPRWNQYCLLAGIGGSLLDIYLAYITGQGINETNSGAYFIYGTTDAQPPGSWNCS